MSTNFHIYVEIIKTALAKRKNNNIDIKSSFCIFDLAEKNGFEVKFVDITSMEGFLVIGKRKTILISSHRPAPRQRFTCAHELAHSFLKHRGAHIDEIAPSSTPQHIYNSPDEKAADQYAAFLLMPLTTVMSGFKQRNIRIERATPLDVFRVASWLGVGYTTLITHLQFALKKISPPHATTLKTIAPKEIKKSIIGDYCQENVLPIDFHWSGRPIDLSIGDYLSFEQRIQYDKNKMEYIDKVNGGYVYRAQNAGIGQVIAENGSWASFVRISRTHYVGRSKFRHLEED